MRKFFVLHLQSLLFLRFHFLPQHIIFAAHGHPAPSNSLQGGLIPRLPMVWYPALIGMHFRFCLRCSCYIRFRIVRCHFRIFFKYLRKGDLLFFLYVSAAYHLYCWKGWNDSWYSGLKIKAARIRQNLTQEELAIKMQLKNIGISQEVISQIEKQERFVADYELLSDDDATF